MDFSTTLNAFSSPLPIYVDDMEGGYDIDPDRPGVWVWGPMVRRTQADGVTPRPIQSIMLALTVQQLSLYQEGNVSQGGIALLTQEQLFYTNIRQPTVEENKQSIVTYQDLLFRVVGRGFISDIASLTGNANFKVYHALRWVQ
jgi:hypothetical protein